jgi:hypothetical protein
MAIKLGCSSHLDERLGFERGGGSRNSPFKMDWYWIGVEFMFEKENYFLFL